MRHGDIKQEYVWAKVVVNRACLACIVDRNHVFVTSASQDFFQQPGVDGLIVDDEDSGCVYLLVGDHFD